MSRFRKRDRDDPVASLERRIGAATNLQDLCTEFMAGDYDRQVSFFRARTLLGYLFHFRAKMKVASTNASKEWRDQYLTRRRARIREIGDADVGTSEDGCAHAFRFPSVGVI